MSPISISTLFGAAVLAVAIVIYARLMRQLIRARISDDKLAWTLAISYLVLMVFFLGGYLTVAFFSPNLDEAFSTILLSGSVFVLLSVVLLASLLRSLDKIRCAQTDTLTGLLTKNAFESIVEREWQRSQHCLDGCCLAIMDMDHFKDVNDTLGHMTGDVLLKRAALAVGRQLEHGEFCGRFGGDEFIIFCTTETAKTFPRRIELAREELRDVRAELCPNVAIDFSVGIFVFAGGCDFHTAFREADAIMYKNKAAR